MAPRLSTLAVAMALGSSSAFMGAPVARVVAPSKPRPASQAVVMRIGGGPRPGKGEQPDIDDDRRNRSPGLQNNFYDKPTSDFKRPYGSGGGGGDTGPGAVGSGNTFGAGGPAVGSGNTFGAGGGRGDPGTGYPGQQQPPQQQRRQPPQQPPPPPSPGQYRSGAGGRPSNTNQPAVDSSRQSRSPGLQNNFYETPTSDFKQPYGGGGGAGAGAPTAGAGPADGAGALGLGTPGGPWGGQMPGGQGQGQAPASQPMSQSMGGGRPSNANQPAIDDDRRNRSPGLQNNFYETPTSDFKRPYGGGGGGDAGSPNGAGMGMGMGGTAGYPGQMAGQPMPGGYVDPQQGYSTAQGSQGYGQGYGQDGGYGGASQGYAPAQPAASGYGLAQAMQAKMQALLTIEAKMAQLEMSNARVQAKVDELEMSNARLSTALAEVTQKAEQFEKRLAESERRGGSTPAAPTPAAASTPQTSTSAFASSTPTSTPAANTGLYNAPSPAPPAPTAPTPAPPPPKPTITGGGLFGAQASGSSPTPAPGPPSPPPSGPSSTGLYDAPSGSS